ncbi:hypothetical protein IWQ60_007018 [Tieghemiomyces parasiticus]|uniref:Uncharacterized protein n=1 Tax=Tieghemiomyces parasiticus TaxID=78921 RepID=A0A9W8DW53_9FUNG|nr:hypothetical protein IWQ60_007018 [Tieghemiomyces parasiticus]
MAYGKRDSFRVTKGLKSWLKRTKPKCANSHCTSPGSLVGQAPSYEFVKCPSCCSTFSLPNLLVTLDAKFARHLGLCPSVPNHQRSSADHRQDVTVNNHEEPSTGGCQANPTGTHPIVAANDHEAPSTGGCQARPAGNQKIENNRRPASAMSTNCEGRIHNHELQHLAKVIKELQNSSSAQFDRIGGLTSKVSLAASQVKGIKRVTSQVTKMNLQVNKNASRLSSITELSTKVAKLTTQSNTHAAQSSRIEELSAQVEKLAAEVSAHTAQSNRIEELSAQVVELKSQLSQSPRSCFDRIESNGSSSEDTVRLWLSPSTLTSPSPTPPRPQSTSTVRAAGLDLPALGHGQALAVPPALGTKPTPHQCPKAVLLYLRGFRWGSKAFIIKKLSGLGFPVSAILFIRPIGSITVELLIDTSHAATFKQLVKKFQVCGLGYFDDFYSAITRDPRPSSKPAGNPREAYLRHLNVLLSGSLDDAVREFFRAELTRVVSTTS